MTIITIPKHLAHGDFLLITRKEYEAKERARKTFRATKAKKRGQAGKVKRHGSYTH